MLIRDMDDRVRVRLKAKISPESRPRPGCSRRGGDEKTGRGRPGPFWRRFGRFFGFLEAAGGKAKNPLSRELNPRLPLYIGRGVTTEPGPRSCCRGTGPEPQLPRPGTFFARPYPLLPKSGAYPRKKRPAAGIGLRPGPSRAKYMAAPATRLERPDLCLERRLVFGPNPNLNCTLPPPVPPESLFPLQGDSTPYFFADT